MADVTPCCRYEKACAEPLIHETTGTHVFLHSVNRFHASSIESAQGLIAFARPAILAVQLPNDQPWGPADAVRERLAIASEPSEVLRIADGYHRVCLGVPAINIKHPAPRYHMMHSRNTPEQRVQCGFSLLP
jgi:hypothetical protein